MDDPLVCGDPLAERRFVYARAAADEGDFAAAADVLEQALERAPGLGGGVVRSRRGAREARRHETPPPTLFARRFAPTLPTRKGRRRGSRSSGGATRQTSLPAAYVARLFDQYAPRFEAHLTGALGYRAPALFAEALSAAAPGRRFVSALDIGCGGGLMGEALRDRVGHLTGVDLSPAMIARARERGVYDALVVDDAVGALASAPPPATFDLIVAADSLVYVGDLAPLFAAAATALTADGLIAFSVETSEGDGFSLGASMRFSHSRAYVEATASAAGLRPLFVRAASIRREAGAEAPGLICVFERDGTAWSCVISMGARRGPNRSGRTAQGPSKIDYNGQLTASDELPA